MALIQQATEVFWTLLEPWLFMLVSVTYIPRTVLALIRAGSYQTFFSRSGFSDALFGQFWADIGPEVKNNAKDRVIPLLEGRVSAGSVHDTQRHTPVGGTVIEVGAGSGMWADVFVNFIAGGDARKRAEGEDAGPVTKVFGIEPNTQSVAALRTRTLQVGLGHVYEVVPVGIEEALELNLIEPESVDAIVCILCLCSIPEPEKNTKLLYKLLKPGGKWYIYEHVRNDKGGLLVRLYQSQFLCFYHRIAELCF